MRERTNISYNNKKMYRTNFSMMLAIVDEVYLGMTDAAGDEKLAYLLTECKNCLDAEYRMIAVSGYSVQKTKKIPIFITFDKLNTLGRYIYIFESMRELLKWVQE